LARLSTALMMSAEQLSISDQREIRLVCINNLYKLFYAQFL
jgi:hypothetical protein